MKIKYPPFNGPNRLYPQNLESIAVIIRLFFRATNEANSRWWGILVLDNRYVAAFGPKFPGKCLKFCLEALSFSSKRYNFVSFFVEFLFF